MTLERLGMSFEVKSVDKKQGIIAGYISSPDVDENDDVVEVKAAKFDDPRMVTPFIGHDHQALPVGIPKRLEYDEKGRLYAETMISKSQAGKDLLIVAEERAEAGIPLGISIGYPHSSVVATWERKGGRLIRHIKSLDLKEYSFTAWPVNPKATVLEVKSRVLAARRFEVKQMSDEEKRCEILEAIKAKGTTEPGPYIYVVSTYDDYVICSDGDNYWKYSYTIGDDGEATVGEPVAVEQSWATKSKADVTLVVKADVSQAMQALEDLEIKAGRVMADKNIKLLQQVHDSAHSMADNAGHDLHASYDGKSKVLDQKTDGQGGEEGKAKQPPSVALSLLELELAETSTR